MKKQKKTRGRKPETLKIKGKVKTALHKILNAPKPKSLK